MSVRKLLTVGIAGLVLAATAACSSSADADDPAPASSASGSAATVEAPETLRIAYQQIPNGDLVVKHNKWLEAALPDTKIDWVRFDSGGDVNTAVVAGAVDIGLAGSSPVTRGLSAPLNIDYQVAWIHDVIGDAESLVARDGSGITSIADLKGHKIATPFASTSHYSLVAALTDAGLSTDDVTLVDLQPGDILAAWTRGDVDAAYVWDPTLSQLGGTVLTTSTEQAKAGHPTYDLGVVTTAVAQKYPGVVDAWLTAQDKAVAQLQDDTATAAEAIGAELDLAPADVTKQLEGLTFLRGTEQLAPEFFGTKAAPGAFAGSLRQAAEFLKTQDAIEAVPAESDLQAGIALDALDRTFGSK